MRNPIIVDLGFGDAGKGTFVDYLANPESVVVRYNGGPQCAHNVITPDGRHHTFAQFGSGTFQGARTHLSRFMLINPLNMLTEAGHLQTLGITQPLELVSVDPRALVITPFHIALNRLKEMSRGDRRHGSTGQGVGECRADSLRHPDLVPRVSNMTSHAILDSTRLWMRDQAEPYYKETQGNPDADSEWAVLDDSSSWALLALSQAYAGWLAQVELRIDSRLEWVHWPHKGGNLIFEGAQGVLLDETHGFAPHNTWTDTTAANAQRLLAENGLEGHVIGVTRTYMTRHGAGPFPTEDETFQRPEQHNGTGKYQGPWRTGPLDLMLLKYAIEACPIDSLAVSHIDQVTSAMPVTYGYMFGDRMVPRAQASDIWDYVPLYHTWELSGPAFAERIARELGVPLAMTSSGPTRDDKHQYAVTQ